MRKRDDYRVAVKSVTLLITIAVCLLIVGLLFLSFCVVEALVLLFTGGAFSLVFPAIATAVAVLAMLAVNHRRKQQDGSYADETSWVDCTIFGKRGESLQANGYLQKGAKLAVVGHLRMSTWEADSQRHRKLEVIVDNIIGMTNYRQPQQPQA